MTKQGSRDQVSIMSHSTPYPLAGLLLALVACSGTTVNDGGGSAGNSGGDSGGGSSSASPLSGTYSGYLENYAFSDGSDAVVMKLAFSASNSVTGTIYFGTGSPLPPATDPTVGYPPGYGESGPDSYAWPLERFDFTVLGGTYASPRVEVSLQPTEVWKHWCEIQTVTYPWFSNDSREDGGCGSMLGYGCLPNHVSWQSGGSGSCAWQSCDTAMTHIDCGKLALCSPWPGTCTCTATSCSMPLPSKGPIAFDMTFAAGALDGSVTWIDGNLHNVHLAKQ